jgi:syntaxin 17
VRKSFENNSLSFNISPQAAKIQGIVLPALGAVVGGVVGGPVGLLAGFKAATLLTAVGGGVIGYKATSYIKNKRDEAVDSELEKLTDSHNRNDGFFD